MPAPRKWLTFFAEGFELEERIVDAIEEDLVVDMLALSVKVLRHVLLQFFDSDASVCCLFLAGLLRVLLSLSLALLLEGQIEFKW